jgi:predicted molibdopterin-dependent oxidoreductase YjgC
MPERFQIHINGQPVEVSSGTLVAAAVARKGISRFHRSPRGESRGPLCGMGVCMECRVSINGRKHLRSCTILCAEGMEVWTDA